MPPGRPAKVALLAAILIGPTAAGALGGAASAAPPEAATLPSPVAHQGQDGFRTIVLDPGHGGTEMGAIGRSGLAEKEIVLDIANRLHDLIEGRLGLDVRLTRETDVDRAWDERTAYANNLKANVFVSIHANAYRGRGVRGPETFFLSDRATDDDARRLAAMENDVLELRGPAASDSGLQMLLWDMAQTQHLRESSVLAEFIQTELNTLAGTTDRGVKQAPFHVLKGATMPAVLVEVGFVSNPEEERLLADPRYRQRIAEALYDSLNRYRRRHVSLVGGGAQR